MKSIPYYMHGNHEQTAEANTGLAVIGQLIRIADIEQMLYNLNLPLTTTD